MKILHILYSGLGGHGNVFFSMVDADKKKEFIYEALFFGIEDVREQYTKKAAERGIKWHFVKKNPGIDLPSYRQIIQIIRQSKSEIIFLHASSYILPAKFASFFSSKKIKIIVRETQPNHLKTKLEWFGLITALLTVNKMVFLSHEYKEELQKKLGFLVRSKRIRVIPNGIDLDLFKPQYCAPNGTIKIGMQSRLAKTKDHTTLLKAFAILKKGRFSHQPIKLFIAGDGECRESLTTLSQDLEIANDVEFLGMLEESQLPVFINSLTIYVHATLGETMSTAIMQVMACGLPVVASNVKGVDNMVQQNVNGLLVPAKDEESLAAAIEEMLINQAKAKMLGQNAYANAQSKYSNVAMFNQYRQLFLSN